jgi:hypothetical protein
MTHCMEWLVVWLLLPFMSDSEVYYSYLCCKLLTLNCVYTIFHHRELGIFPFEKISIYNMGANENAGSQLHNFMIWTLFEVHIPSV